MYCTVQASLGRTSYRIGRENGLSVLEFAAQLLELSDCTIVRVATQQKSVWWLFRFGGLDDGECSAHRISR